MQPSKWIWRVFLLFLPLLFAWQKPAATYHSVQALRGDTQKTLLERYALAGFSCNVARFRALNQLKWNAPIIANRVYFLPIRIYQFDGKSIRSSIGNKDFDLARRVQLYNEKLTRERLRKKNYLESKILWVPIHEIESCRPSAAPQNPGGLQPTVQKGKLVGTFPIFGSKNSRVVSESNKLQGRIYYVESGHGGPDPGATARVSGRTLCEDEYAYDIGLRVARKLVANGATVYIINRDANDGIRSGQFLTCDCDELTYPAQKPPRNQKQRLFQRSDIINKLYETNKKRGIKQQRALIIHVESRGASERADAFFYHKAGDKEGQRLALNMQKHLKQKYKHRVYKGTVQARDLHMVREPKTSNVFVEVGNIRNVEDQKRLMLEKNRALLALWLYEGLIL